MCDCYNHQCDGPNCSQMLPLHIGDYCTPRRNIRVFCSRHLPRNLKDFSGTVWKWVRDGQWDGYDDVPKGMKMGIVVLDKSLVSGGWKRYKNQIYPNSVACEQIKDWNE